MASSTLRRCWPSEAAERAESDNISYFAFTATPRPRHSSCSAACPTGSADGQAAAVPCLHDAAGDRGGLHP